MKNKKMKALIIEDNKLVQEITKVFVEEAGYKVDMANDGESGLTLLKKKSYQIVLIDIGLPGISGYEVIKKFQTWNKKAVIIVMTAHADDELKNKCLNIGCVVVLDKPFDAEILKKYL